MKLSDFVLTKTIGKSALDWEYFADVAVTTGALWWKRTERKTIHRKFGDFWHFLDGSLTPAYQAEQLERGYRATQALGACRLSHDA